METTQASSSGLTPDRIPTTHLSINRTDLPASTVSAQTEANRAYIENLLSDLTDSPTPYHAVDRAIQRLNTAGFQLVDLAVDFPSDAGAYIAASGGTVAAWIQPEAATATTSFAVVGAHTDSPNLRVKGNADIEASGYSQLNVEVYGGVLLNSWLNRDLGLAGRVIHESNGELAEVLVSIDAPLLTIPQLAIHLDRDVNKSGLQLNSQQHLKPIWTLAAPSEAAADEDHGGRFVSFMGDMLDVDPDHILAWDLMAYDLQPASLLGQTQEFIASARIDNLLSSFAGVHALVDMASATVDTSSGTGGNLDQLPGDGAIPVLVLYDHEEIGSESATGAAGSFLVSLLERIATAVGMTRAEFLAAGHRSLVVSADGAHATHPNYPDRHDPTHTIELNGGVVIKRNANQRYATEAVTESFVRSVCRRRQIPHQLYHHRNDLPCGSTIGPITAARLGTSTVDLGAPQLSMHSIRETAGTLDAIHLRDTLLGVWMDRGPSR